MQLNLGMKIRELRRRDGRTQEAMAEALGITPQAVSRWESSGSYSDMEMIPSIANYFGVTIDELFGYQNDRERKIQTIIDMADKEIQAIGNLLAKNHGDITECVEMLRVATEEFPNEPRLLIKLGDALHILGWQKNDQNHWLEALHVYEKLLKMDIPSDYRGSAIFTMILLYKRTGSYEKAKTLAMEQDSLLLCKEVLLPKATMGEEYERYQGEAIIALLQELFIVISDSVASKSSIYCSEYGRNVLLSLVNLFETIFDDGCLGSQHMNMRYLYLALANYEAQYGGNMQKSLHYFDKGVEHHTAYCNICNTAEYHYSAPLVANVTTPGEKIPSVPENFWDNWLQNMPQNLIDALRKTCRMPNI